MVRANDIVNQPSECSDGKACDNSRGAADAAFDRWKPGQSDPKIQWGRTGNSESNADLHVPSVWDKFDTLSKNRTFDDLYQRLASLELRAAEMELQQARSALLRGDGAGAAADMNDAQHWFGASEKDFARGVSAGADKLGTAPADGAERPFAGGGGGGCGEGGCGGPGRSGGGTGLGSESDSVETPPVNYGSDGDQIEAPQGKQGSEGDYIVESGENEPPATMPPTWNFTARDGKIYDPNGREFMPVGVNITPYDNPLGNIDKITNDWNMNFIRLNCWDWGKNKPQTPDEIKAIVDEYTKRGVVVNIELHGPSGHIMEGKELSEAANWYRELANRYKDNPNVWFGTPNEAGTNDTSQFGKWLNEEKTILGAIRGTGAMNMVTINDTCWGQGATQGGASALERYNRELEAYGNVIAEQHEYNPNGNAYERLVSSQNKLISSGWDAVVLGEVGTTNGTWPDKIFDTSNGMRAAMKNAQVNKRGLVAWGFKYAEKVVPGGDNSLTKDGNLNGARTEMGSDLWTLTHR